MMGNNNMGGMGGMGGGGYTPDPVRPRSGGSGVGPQGDDLMAKVKAWSSKVEDVIETYSQVSGFCTELRSHWIALGAGRTWKTMYTLRTVEKFIDKNLSFHDSS